jgi:DNA repair photolyase
MKISEIHVKGVLTRSSVVGVDYSLNPYIGCSFSCAYCYADFMRRFTQHEEPWGGFVDVKVNAAEVLASQLQMLSPGRVVVSLVTDPYQPIERRFKLTRRCLEVFNSKPCSELFSLSILTRSVLVLRDVDLLSRLRNVEVGLTITTDDDSIRRIFEPRTPPISDRLKTLQQLKSAGVKTYAFIGPMLPMNPNRLAKNLKGIVDHVLLDKMNYDWKARHLYEAHGLEYALEPKYASWARQKLETAFERSGIPAEYVGERS